MKKAYDEMKIFTDFFNTTKYWKMKEHNELVPGYSNFNRVYTLADPGDEYVVYSAAGNSFDINLEPGLYSVVLFDPRTGTSIEQGVVNGGLINFNPPSPSSDDWVYHLKSTQCIDNDGDGYGVDCFKGPDCDDANPVINPGACDVLNDGIDQDCNGRDRTKGKACPGSPADPEICYDGIDNDGDGKTDCADQDCDGVSGCEYGTELSCVDGIDNDGDGKMDCADKKDCRQDPDC
jgi:hypothetical protein